jgi:hypothetical protein
MTSSAADATELWDAFAATKVGAGEHLADDDLEWGDELMMRELGELFEPEDGEGPPSEPAFDAAIELIEQTGAIMYSHLNGMSGDCWDFPRGYVATDDNGGLHIEWWKGGKVQFCRWRIGSLGVQ